MTRLTLVAAVADNGVIGDAGTIPWHLPADFAHFKVVFEDEPDQVRIVWLFSLVLGHSRYLWARFVVHQDVQTVLRCHMAAFEHLQGVPRQICESACNTDPIGADFRVEI